MVCQRLETFKHRDSVFILQVIQEMEIAECHIVIAHFIHGLSGLWAERSDPVDFIIPEFYPVSHALESFDGGEYIHGFTFCPETSPFELEFVVHVKGVYQTS